MFYHLLYPLREFFFGFNVFRYITFRAAGAAISAFLLSILLGPVLIRLLKKYNIVETAHRPECPPLYQFYQTKEGVPTMGGILINFSVIVSTFLWAKLTNPYIILTLAAVLYLGVVGFFDDYLKAKKRGTRGLSAISRLLAQALLGLAIGCYIYLNPEISTRLDIPLFKNLIVDLGIFYIFFVVLVIVGSSNAVNLTDGLDGLAIGCVIMAALSYAGFSYLSGHIKFSEYLHIIHIPQAGELAVFCAALAGAGLGFLWYNSYPAQVFMGNTASLALGGAVGVVSVFIKKELLLLLVGGVFVAEALSVILQVGYFRRKKQRLFLVAPLHHHFQVKGWSESKVTVRFWIVAAVLALLSLATLKLR